MMMIMMNLSENFHIQVASLAAAEVVCETGTNHNHLHPFASILELRGKQANNLNEMGGENS